MIWPIFYSREKITFWKALMLALLVVLILLEGEIISFCIHNPMKTSDEELNQWRFDQKRNPVSIRFRGDPDIAILYLGEAKSLLWTVKNAMSFNKLMQGEGESPFLNGTTVRVWSVFGQDFVLIDTSRVVEGITVGLAQSCKITFISMPLIVQPMRFPHVIKADEKINVDYIKTYYKIEVNNCPTCQDIKWEFTFNYSDPFEPRHYIDPAMKDEPNNHSVYSLLHPCWAELLQRGRDAVGNFIIWKAYTESGQYSRTGLGILLIKASIRNSAGILCKQQAKLDVDCCKKDGDLRKVEIWWEDFGTCAPFIMYGGSAICKMPPDLPQNLLISYSMRYRYNQAPLYAIPEINGGCIPFDWKLDGPGTLIVPDEDQLNAPHSMAYYVVNPNPDCRDKVVITLKDRCGTTYQVKTVDPCGLQQYDPLAIGYTSLIMSCGTIQILQAHGGIGPYQWSLSGGGSLSELIGIEVTYTAPETNPNCTSNPTITLRDCCGNTSSITLAVNCYTGPDLALQYCTYILCNACAKNGFCKYRATYGRYQYRCDSVLLSEIFWDYPGNYVAALECYGGNYWGCGQSGGGFCGNDPAEPCNSNCIINQCLNMGAGLDPCCGGLPCLGQVCGTLADKRTEEMKNAGCCPLNPLTGLPYTG